MKSDRTFKDFLASAPLGKIIPILIFGIALIVLGFVFSGEKDESGNENELSLLCSEIEGVGECRVTVTYDKEGAVYGVGVLCDGADDPSVKARLVDFFTSLYGVGANRITVLKISEKK